MGAFCSRRHQPTQAQNQEDEWILIQNWNPARRQKWKPAIRTVIRMLTRRRIWSQLGKWLKKPGSHQATYRPVLASFWHAEGRQLEQYSDLFSHLVRKDGVLKYKSK